MHNLRDTYYFVGIGGISMSGLAAYYLSKGALVMGYDKTPSPITQDLAMKGAVITYDAAVEALPPAVKNPNTIVVVTAAIPFSHPQIAYFLECGNKVIKRAAFLGAYCKDKYALAVAGTHGKTTTLSLLAHIYSNSEEQFTAFLGGILNQYESNLIHRGDTTALVEADEFDRSFLELHPNLAAITSMDADHLDIYGAADAVAMAFRSFAAQVKDQLIVAYGLPLEGLTYGIQVPADYAILNYKKTETGYIFDLQTPSGNYHNNHLPLLGAHNLSNALCAIALADQAQLNMPDVLEAVATFPGVYRRMNVHRLGHRILIDDYAHHPTELRGLYDTVQEFYATQKKCILFQPHLFSRTRDFMEGFVSVLKQFDEVLLLEIYPARELPIEGVSSAALLAKMDHKNAKVITKNEILSALEQSSATLFVFAGAGDIGLEVAPIVNHYSTAV